MGAEVVVNPARLAVFLREVHAHARDCCVRRGRSDVIHGLKLILLRPVLGANIPSHVLEVDVRSDSEALQLWASAPPTATAARPGRRRSARLEHGAREVERLLMRLLLLLLHLLRRRTPQQNCLPFAVHVNLRAS